MSWYSLDIETDGPYPHKYSMLSIGIVKVDHKLETTFYAEMMPVHREFMQEAMEVNQLNREFLLAYGKSPVGIMREIAEFLHATSYKDPVMVADNPQFDGQFVNHYMWEYLGFNPFGHSARRISDMWMGIKSVHSKYGHNLGYYAAPSEAPTAEAELALSKGENIQPMYLPITDWRQLRKTNHTHNALDDAMGNAEALRTMATQYGLEIPI